MSLTNLTETQSRRTTSACVFPAQHASQHVQTIQQDAACPSLTPRICLTGREPLAIGVGTPDSAQGDAPTP